MLLGENCRMSSSKTLNKRHRFPPEFIQYADNRAELSHQPTRVRERGRCRFKSIQQAQRFLNVHAAVYNLFNLGRHLISAKHYRIFRLRAFAPWKCAVA